MKLTGVLVIVLGAATAAVAQHDHGAMKMGGAPSDAHFCVAQPSAKNCTSFQLPEADARADLEALCKAMDFMPACSVASACASAAPDAVAANGSWTARVGPGPAVCTPFNLLATVCARDTGMGGMAGCRTHYAGLCAKGSAVAACSQLPGLAQLPTTKAANDAVKQLCTARRTRPGCAACLPSFDADKTYGNCDLLATWGDICAAEPKLPQCAGHAALCAKEASWFFCRGKALEADKQLADTNVAPPPPPPSSGALRRTGLAAATAGALAAAALLALA